MTTIPKGTTHPEHVSCPFDEREFSTVKVGMGTCCSMHGEYAARELMAFGQLELAFSLERNQTAEESLFLATMLSETANWLERINQHREPRPLGAGWNEFEVGREIVSQYYSTFEEALATIRETAAWYRKVGLMGFGVVVDKQ